MKSSAAMIALLLAANPASAKDWGARPPRWHELDASYSFGDYCRHFNKNEASAERRQLFEARLGEALRHNADPAQTYRKGMNHLSDRTEAELKALMGIDKALHQAGIGERAAEPLMAAAKPRQKTESLRRALAEEEPGAPTTGVSALAATASGGVDWRAVPGVVTPVKDQGGCGSCWAFAAGATLEAHWALAGLPADATMGGPIMELSEEFLLQCTVNDKHCGGDGGCQGATAQLAFDAAIAKGGMATEWAQPYLSHGGEHDKDPCNAGGAGYAPGLKVESHTTLPTNQQAPLLSAVKELGPIAISVDANAWSTYETGVFSGCNKTNPDINHAVQLVGYDTDPASGLDFYLVRNSWTTGWGDSGYIKILRTSGDDSKCGTDIKPQDGTGCAGGPATVQACGECGILIDSSYPVIAK